MLETTNPVEVVLALAERGLTQEALQVAILFLRQANGATTPAAARPVQTEDSDPDEPPTWVSSAKMAAALGISVKTLHRLRTDPVDGAFLVEGVHFRAQTPKPGSPLAWNHHRTMVDWRA